MNRITMSRVATILATMALPILALPVEAFAQTGPSMAPSASTAPGLSKPMSEKVEQHIKQLHDQLVITAAEEPQWAQFAAVMRDNAAQMQQAFTMRGADAATMSAADNMQSYAQLAQLHAANMQKLAGAFQLLYNTFPDQQKKIADGVFQSGDGKPALTKH